MSYQPQPTTRSIYLQRLIPYIEGFVYQAWRPAGQSLTNHFVSDLSILPFSLAIYLLSSSWTNISFRSTLLLALFTQAVSGCPSSCDCYQSLFSSFSFLSTSLSPSLDSSSDLPFYLFFNQQPSIPSSTYSTSIPSHGRLVERGRGCVTGRYHGPDQRCANVSVTIR